jgi:8-oxo-dGTP pyrophosphatase MutT (NUDIX family)
MKKFLPLVGKPAFWLSLPLLYFYLRWSRRTRVLIIAEGKVLLVKGWYGSGKWTLPGGGLHKGEDSKNGAIREVFEETGLTLTPEQLQPLGEGIFLQYGLRFVFDKFFVELPRSTTLTPLRAEITDITWLPLEEINNNRVEYDVNNTIETWRGLHRLIK